MHPPPQPPLDWCGKWRGVFQTVMCEARKTWGQHVVRETGAGRSCGCRFNTQCWCLFAPKVLNKPLSLQFVNNCTLSPSNTPVQTEHTDVTHIFSESERHALSTVSNVNKPQSTQLWKQNRLKTEKKVLFLHVHTNPVTAMRMQLTANNETQHVFNGSKMCGKQGLRCIPQLIKTACCLHFVWKEPQGSNFKNPLVYMINCRFSLVGKY